MFQKNLTKLKIGEAYLPYDSKGHYIGCFAPLYVLFPDLPLGFLGDCSEDYFEYPFERLKGLFDAFLGADEPCRAGDVAVFCFVTKNKKKVLHVGVMLDKERFFHSKRGRLSEVARLRHYRAYLLGFLRKA